jgi:DnaJ-class molecular chaperone
MTEEVIVEVPKKLTKKQRELLIEFEKEKGNKGMFGIF